MNTVMGRICARYDFSVDQLLAKRSFSGRCARVGRAVAGGTERPAMANFAIDQANFANPQDVTLERVLA